MADHTNGSNSDWKFYRYDPSMVAAIIFIVLFVLTTFLHLYQLIRTRTWYFIPLVVGGFFELIGYIGRALSANQTPNWTLGPYITQTLLLLIAPALFAASIYMELGYIILLVDGERHSLVREKWLTKIFVAGDVLAFTVQAGGGGIMAGKTLKSMNLGSKIVVVGLFFQILFFGLFMLTAIIFDRRIRKNPTPQSISPTTPWRKHLIVLFIASGLILVRSVFRIIEYIQGNSGYLLEHEYWLYIFDSVLMFGVMVVFNLVHPSEVKALLKGGKMSRGFVKLETVNERPKNDENVRGTSDI